MTDELSIQQKKPSALPYMGVGAAAAGTAGYFGLPKIEAVNKWIGTNAKYDSWDKLINEAEDTFAKNMDGLEGEEKTLMEQAREARNEAKVAGENWEKEFAAFKETNKAGELKPLEASNPLNGELQTAQDQLAAKRKELYDGKLKELAENNTGKLTDKEQKVYDTLTKKIQEVEKEKADYITKQEAAIKDFNTELVNKRSVIERAFNAVDAQEKAIADIEHHLGLADKSQRKAFKKGTKLTFIDPTTKRVTTLDHKALAKLDIGEIQKRVKLAKAYNAQTLERNVGVYLKNIKDPAVRTAIIDQAREVVLNSESINESIASREKYISDLAAKFDKAQQVAQNETEMIKTIKEEAKEARRIANANPTDAVAKARADQLEQFVTKYNTNTYARDIASVEAKIKTLEADIAAATDKTTKKAKIAELKVEQNKLSNLIRNKASLESSFESYYRTTIQRQLGTQGVDLETQRIYKDIARREELINKSGSSARGPRGMGRRIGEWLGIPHPGLNSAEASELSEIERRLVDTKNRLGETKFASYESAASGMKVKDIQNEITKLEKQIADTTKAMSERSTAYQQVKKITAEVEQIVGQKGAKFDFATGKIILADGSTFIPKSTLNLASEVSLPGVINSDITALEQKIAHLKRNMPSTQVLTQAELEQKAAQLIDSEAGTLLKKEKDAIKLIEEKILAERQKLGTLPEKTEAELKALFEKSNGTKEAAVKNVETKFKDKLAKLFEGNRSNWKFGAAVAGTAAAGALLALAFRPSKKDA